MHMCEVERVLFFFHLVIQMSQSAKESPERHVTTSESIRPWTSGPIPRRTQPMPGPLSSDRQSDGGGGGIRRQPATTGHQPILDLSPVRYLI